jgi:hypothetical protein
MQKSWITGFAAGTLLILSLSPLALDAQNRQRTAQPPQPAPRWADGRPNLGAPLGEKGYWSRTRRQLVIDSEVTNPLPTDLKVGDVPFQPWAKGLWEYRRAGNDRDSPHARCKPSAGPRQIGTAYGFEIVEMQELKRILILDIGGPQTFRTVYMDGRPHPEKRDLQPSYYGHSIGRWEGDTLVVDSVGFNEANWIDTEGLMHTDQYHQTERFTRVDMNTLKYEVTVDDPGAYTKPWTAGFLLRWNAGDELFEYICQDNNMNGEMIIDDNGNPLARVNEITP